MGNREKELALAVLPRTVRFLAIVSGGVSAVFFLWMGLPLVLGAVLQPRAPTTARWLMWVGAIVVSLPFFVLAPGAFGDLERMIRLHDGPVSMSSLFILAEVLLVASDVSLIWNAVANRRAPWIRGGLDAIVWIAAAGLSTWQMHLILRISYAYRVNGRLDIFVNVIGFAVLMLLFDAGLIMHALKTRRA